MTYEQMQKRKQEVYPALLLDRTCSLGTRKKIRRVLGWALVIFGLLFVISFFTIESYRSIFQVLTAFIFCFYIGFQLLESMYRSYYHAENTVDIHVLSILDKVQAQQDLTQVFLTHYLGQYVMNRLGFSASDIQEFLQNKKTSVLSSQFHIIGDTNGKISFSEFGSSLFHLDDELSHFLKSHAVLHDDFKQVLKWVCRIDTEAKNSERWWTPEKMSRIPSLGKNLSFGQVYYLERFGHSIMNDSTYIQLGGRWRLYIESVNKVETVLAKKVGGNVMLTAPESYIGLEAVASLGKEIMRGTVLPELEKKRMYVLDMESLFDTYENPLELESMLGNILHQAGTAGNVILVIPKIARAMQSAHALGIDISTLLGTALESNLLHVIATASTRDFHEVIETDFDLMSHFEKIQLKEFDAHHTLTMLQREVLHMEAREQVFCTYQALQKIVESADRYFGESSLLDKSIDILMEVVPYIKKKGQYIIYERDIDALVSAKTGIALGKITQQESQKLGHLKEELHQRVVGQEKAIQAVSDAMLRARTGLANPKRPLASFLFVGPTGVGKTETSKALAQVFFGDEEKMLRLDMSEYSDTSAVVRMIGDAHTTGVFASKVRETGHGVLLIDEFEKSSPEVQDLFLQILDEGFFSDGRGERVSVRNFIIIATSNLASDILYIQDPKKPLSKHDLIEHVIATQGMRPELINRFDDVILFSQLTEKEIESIAHILVGRMQKRLEQKGIILKETPELLTYLARVGYNPQFGAREMQRVISKEMESRIAQSLVLGDLFEGDTISFTVSGDNLEIQKYT